IDVETIASSYAPPAAIARLLFIAEKTTSDATRLESLKLAINLLKTKTSDTATYARVVERVDGRLGDDYALDKGWIEETDKASANRQAVLERELSAYKTNSIKESVRMGHNDLGDFHHSRGALAAAFKCYVRARDYCTTPRHVVGMCLNVVRVSIESENFAHVGNYVQKALATAPDVGKEEPTVFAKLQVASALAYLDQKKYKDAATKFTELGMELEEEYNEVVTAGDVATYGALCALASFDRKELKEKVMDSVTFRAMMESAPAMRDLVNDFHGSKYKKLFDGIDDAKPVLELDLHLHDHVESLYAAIRKRALVQYCIPYSVVDLNRMGEAFRTRASPELERELAGLIAEREIAARIDAQAGTMEKRASASRESAFKAALGAGKEYRRSTAAMLVRASIVKH
ncbi:uncharacterized protein MICPUCDRAFT_3283, partial [Micromonas pusilla CCMP1545]